MCQEDGRTVSTASRVLPRFHPGFMPAKCAAAVIVLNFAVEGHVTAVTFPEGNGPVGNAASSLAIYCKPFKSSTYSVHQQVHLGAKLLRAPNQMRSEPSYLNRSTCDARTSSSLDFRANIYFSRREGFTFRIAVTALHSSSRSNIDSGTRCPDPYTTHPFIVPNR
jgi:hypothetical protein